MKKMIVTSITLIGLTVSSNLKAGESMSEEEVNGAIGFGAGALTGALIAGPVGAAVGGVFGILLADDAGDRKELQAARSQLDRQQRQLFALQSEYEQAKHKNQVQLVAMDRQIERIMQEMESNIQFKTASYVLEQHFKSQLKLVAKGLADNPELVVSLSGFADSRGDSSYNQALSEQRVLSVKDFLIAQGVKQQQILSHSYGESNPVSAQVSGEDHFFDRRVLVRVEKGTGSMTASNL